MIKKGSGLGDSNLGGSHMCLNCSAKTKFFEHLNLFFFFYQIHFIVPKHMTWMTSILQCNVVLPFWLVLTQWTTYVRSLALLFITMNSFASFPSLSINTHFEPVHIIPSRRKKHVCRRGYRGEATVTKFFGEQV